MGERREIFTRVVTGHDADGKDVVVSNAPPVRSQLAHGAGGKRPGTGAPQTRHTHSRDRLSAGRHAVHWFGGEGATKLISLVSGCCLLAVVLNGFDMPAPETHG